MRFNKTLSHCPLWVHRTDNILAYNTFFTSLFFFGIFLGSSVESPSSILTPTSVQGTLTTWSVLFKACVHSFLMERLWSPTSRTLVVVVNNRVITLLGFVVGEPQGGLLQQSTGKIKCVKYNQVTGD